MAGIFILIFIILNILLNFFGRREFNSNKNGVLGLFLCGCWVVFGFWGGFVVYLNDFFYLFLVL